MNIPAEFDEIRPYTPEELPRVYDELAEDPAFKRAITYVFPQLSYEMFVARMKQCRTNEEFQITFCKPFLEGLLKEHSAGGSWNFEALEPRTLPCTFISNHRDIVLDSAFLSIFQVADGAQTPEIAIGDNLLIEPWIKKLVRVNKSFIVQRSLTMREMLASSKRLSEYIHYVIAVKNNPVWIAQREGRAKDSNDHTQESVLKMLAMGGEGSVKERLISLNIVPLALTYEYDPCDYLKAQEFQQKRDNPDFKKSQHDDLVNMGTGIFGYKGHVHDEAAPCINEAIAALDDNMPKNELFEEVARMIDRGIYSRYAIYPVNYIAYEELTGDHRFAAKCSQEEREKVMNYLAQRVEMVELPTKDEIFLRHKILEMYANPLINQIKAAE